MRGYYTLLVILLGCCVCFFIAFFTGVHTNLHSYTGRWSSGDGQYKMNIRYTDTPHLYEVQLRKGEEEIVGYKTTFTPLANATYQTKKGEGKIKLRIRNDHTNYYGSSGGEGYIKVELENGMDIELYRM